MDSKLIYDIGLHKGEDTLNYLRQGHKVVAVEANPVLVEQAAKKFVAEIAEGRLVLLNIGIAPAADGQEPTQTLTFWVNEDYSQWSSFDQALGCRRGTKCHSVEVHTKGLGEIIKEHGVPWYLKIDIEGYDLLCLQQIPDDALPTYVSCEATQIEIFDVLRNKGYKHFKLINQRNGFRPIKISEEKSGLWQFINSVRWFLADRFPITRHKPHSSGPFGEQTRGKWLSFDEVVGLYRQFYPEEHQPLNDLSWFDLHAKL